MGGKDGMTGLYQNNVLITKRIESAVSLADTIKVEKRLLNGQFHTQIIGTGATTLNVVVHLSLSQKNLIDNYERTGTPIKVMFDGRYYNGTIKTAPIAERIMRDRFIVSFTMNVNSQGDA
jgi:hypothetical protein